ncbi:trehalose synthase, partial [Rhizobium ruizarguesonis]
RAANTAPRCLSVSRPRSISSWLRMKRPHCAVAGRGFVAALGPEKDMQLYDRGIRRSLAPMLGGDRRRIEMAYSMLFSLPGTPVIRYGDEIG